MFYRERPVSAASRFVFRSASRRFQAVNRAVRPSGCSFGPVGLAPLGAFFPNAFMTKATLKKDVVATKAAETAPQDAKRRPLKTYRQGDVSASVWARDHVVRGEPRRFYSVTFERSYRDGDGKYRYTRSFSPDDLGALVSTCQQTGDYLLSLEFPNSEGQRQD